jgi:hypothetical protein
VPGEHRLSLRWFESTARGTSRFTRYLRPLLRTKRFPVREDAARAF